MIGNAKAIARIFAKWIIVGGFAIGAFAEVSVKTLSLLPKIDGVLDESFWEKAPVTGTFATRNEIGGSAAEDTIARLAVDDAWLYIGVSCRNPAIKWLTPKFAKHDSPPGKEEAVVIMIAPEANGKTCYAFSVTFAGVTSEEKLTRTNR